MSKLLWSKHIYADAEKIDCISEGVNKLSISVVRVECSCDSGHVININFQDNSELTIYTHNDTNISSSLSCTSDT